MQRTLLGPSLLFAVLAGRDSGGQTLPAPRVRDSAGVRIVEYSTIKTALPAFTVAPKLVADAGGLRDDPKDEIDAKTGYESAVRLSNNAIAVVEYYAVRVLDATGKFVRVLGQRGGGPGEFNGQVHMVCVMPGDTIVALDGSRRMNVFAPSGSLVRSVTLEGYVQACVGDGSLLAEASTPSASHGRGGSSTTPASEHFDVELKPVSRAGRLGDLIGTFAGPSTSPLISQRFSTAAFGDRIYADNGDSAEVKAYTKNGKLSFVIRWHDPLRRLTPELMTELAEFRLGNQSSPDHDSQVRRMAAIHHPATLQAYSGFFVDRAGRVWVRDNFPVTKAERQNWQIGWTIFDARGTLLGRYDFTQKDRRQMVTDAGENFVVVRSQSADEGVRVTIQSIRPTR